MGMEDKTVFIGGETFTIAEANRCFGMASQELISSRVRAGWDHAKAVLTPSRTVKAQIRERFGLHMFFDGYGADLSKLVSLDEISEFLGNLPGKVGMRKISQPHVFKYESANEPNDWGVTGTVVLATSHASIHTFPERHSFLTADLYSCSVYNPYEVLRIFQTFFKCERYSITLAVRGAIGHKTMLVHPTRRSI